MGFLTDRAIPEGSLILVSGVNGFIASHVADQLLRAGYRVRGTVRSLQRGGWVKDHFASKYGADKIELVEVPNMGDASAFDEAMHGAAGAIHVATPVMQSLDPNEAVPTVVAGAINILTAAAKEPSVKRVVLASSSTAASAPKPNLEFVIDENTWNHEDVEAAWKPPPYEGVARKLAVYSASKMQSEEAAWKWMKDNKPAFTLSTVLPNGNMGLVLDPENQGTPSTVGWLKALFNGFEGQEDLQKNPPQYYVNVQDNARVHVGALIGPDVKNERLFAFAHPYNWNDILAIFRELYPEQKFISDYPNLGRDLSKVANERAEELVKRFGRPGWTSLKDSVKDAVFWA